MSTFLLSLTSLILSTIAQEDQENLCLWGHYDMHDRPINGLYRRGSEQVNDKWYWKLDRSDQECTGKYYYIFYYDVAPWHGWYIGLGTGDSFGFSIQSVTIGKCKNDGVVNTPVDCGTQWSIGVGSDANDPYPDSNIFTNVEATWGRCPALNCNQLTITTNGWDACYGQATQTGTNEYAVQGDSWIWWFNEPVFQWFCTERSKVAHTCVYFSTEEGLKNIAAYQEWQDLSDGNSFVYDDSFGQTGKFTCSGSAVTTTYAPTTKYPTQADIPTPFPTYKPISWAPPTMPTAPTAPTLSPGASAPTVSQGGGGDDDDDDDDNNGNGNGGDDDDDDKSSILSGLGGDSLLWIIIVIIAVCLCCCIIGCIIVLRKRKSGHEQYFGSNDL